MKKVILLLAIVVSFTLCIVFIGQKRAVEPSEPSEVELANETALIARDRAVEPSKEQEFEIETECPPETAGWIPIDNEYPPVGAQMPDEEDEWTLTPYDEIVTEEPTYEEEYYDEEEYYEEPVYDEPVYYDYPSGDSVLTPDKGVNYYNGVLETYYNLDMSGVVEWMHSLGYEGEYWVRSDGVKMFGDYVMVASDYSYEPKGTITETSLGLGIVCDTGLGGWGWHDIAVSWG